MRGIFKKLFGGTEDAQVPVSAGELAFEAQFDGGWEPTLNLQWARKQVNGLPLGADTVLCQQWVRFASSGALVEKEWREVRTAT